MKKFFSIFDRGVFYMWATIILALAVPCVLQASGSFAGTGPTSGVPISQRVRRNTTQLASDTTTLVADTQLSANLTAGKKYSFRIVYYFTTVNTSGVKVDLNGGTASMTSIQASMLMWNLSTPALLATGTAETTALNTAIGITVSGTNVMVEINGGMVCNAGGTFIPRFAQNAETGSAESITAKTDSHMWIVEMP